MNTQRGAGIIQKAYVKGKRTSMEEKKEKPEKNKKLVLEAELGRIFRENSRLMRTFNQNQQRANEIDNELVKLSQTK